METDLLWAQRYSMVALGFLAQDLLGGTNTQVFGAVATPGTGLTVSISPGRIYQLVDLEATAWSSLPADTSDLIIKQGILFSASTLSGFAAPLTAGYSIDYLIEGQYQDVDTNLATLSYYNSANPQQPYSGAGNNGLAQPTTRQGLFALQVKAGVAATTGTQTPPVVDSGWAGLYVVTVAYGQTTISAGNITAASSSPANNGTLTLTPSGFTVNTPVPVPYTINSNGLIFLNLNGISGTSNSTSFTLSGLPAAFIPPTATPTQTCVLVGQNNGAVVLAYGIIQGSSGVISFAYNGFSTGWTASGVKGIGGNMVYSLYAGNPSY